MLTLDRIHFRCDALVTNFIASGSAHGNTYYFIVSLDMFRHFVWVVVFVVSFCRTKTITTSR